TLLFDRIGKQGTGCPGGTSQPARQRPGVCIYDYQFVPPWPDHDFLPLPAFAESSRGGAYVLPNNWDFPRDDVLNFKFGKSGWRIPCTRVEAVLCALSATAIPQEIQHGAEVSVGVKFISRSGRQLAETTASL